MKEVWVPVKGYEGMYEVSDLGNVRSLDRAHLTRHKSGKLMSRPRKGSMKALTPDKNGYLKVRLCKNGKAKTVGVHRVVLLSFLGENPCKPEGCHFDNNPSNNQLSNLYWGTRQENEDHKTATGCRPITTVNKLTRKDVDAAFRLRSEGLTLMEIGKRIGTHLSNVSLILKGKTWKSR